MRIVVLGASGTIGHQLFSDALVQGLPTIGTCLSRPAPQLYKFDLMSGRLVELVPDLSEEDCVYILSAYINPNWIFENPDEARHLNVDATIKIIDEAFSRDAKVIFLSTELVFDGTTGGYRESDPPNPTTLYGKLKVEVENYLGGSQGRSCILRTGASVSFRESDNCPIVKTFETLQSDGAKMAADNIFSLTDVRDTSAVLLKLANHSENEIYHATSKPPISRVELANWIIENSDCGSPLSFEDGRFDEIPYPEVRPKYSWLSSQKLIKKFGVHFASPESTVKRKMAYINRWHARLEGSST